MNKTLKLVGSIFVPVLLVGTVAVTLLTPTKIEHKKKDEMLEASTLTMNCFNAIKDYKIEHGISKSSEDIYDSYMLGQMWSDISTTDGELGAKLTTVNPNFAALYIKFFEQANLKPGDQIATIFSGSFPCLNIACLAACKVYGLDAFVMASVGASGYGANDVNFTSIDMIHYLNTIGLLDDDVDLASYGGYADNMNKFGDIDEEILSPIRERIEGYGIDFIYYENFHENVLYRRDLVLEKVPNLKLFVNVGGTSLGLGLGNSQFEKRAGYFNATEYSVHNENSQKIGLIDCFLNRGIDVVHMLHVKNIAATYGIPYNPTELPSVGEGDVYYDIKYHIALPIISLTISTGLLVVYYIDRKKELKNTK